MNFSAVLFWELLQNIPLTVGIIVSSQFWQQGNRIAASVCILVGGISAALIINATEGKIFDDYEKSRQAVINNATVLPALMLMFVVYLAAGWSSYWTDVIAGSCAAAALTVLQDPDPKKKFNIARGISLGASCIASLLFIRWLMDASFWASIVAVTAWFTLVMSIYKQIRLRTGLVKSAYGH